MLFSWKKVWLWQKEKKSNSILGHLELSYEEEINGKYTKKGTEKTKDNKDNKLAIPGSGVCGNASGYSIMNAGQSLSPHAHGQSISPLLQPSSFLSENALKRTSGFSNASASASKIATPKIGVFFVNDDDDEIFLGDNQSFNLEGRSDYELQNRSTGIYSFISFFCLVF